MHCAILIPDWNSLDSVRRAHNGFEIAALTFFGLLVLFDILSHLAKDAGQKTRLEKIGLFFFAVAVSAEIVAFIYGHRNDTLATQVISSLDAKAGEAFDKASKAHDLAQSASDIAGPAKQKAEEAESKTDTVSKKAERINMQLGMMEFLMSARVIRDPAGLTNEFRQFKGQSVTLKSYIGDVEGWNLCTQLWYIAHNAEMTAVDKCGTEGLTSQLIIPLTVFGPDMDETVKIGGLIARYGAGAASGFKAPSLIIFVGSKGPVVLGETAQTRDVERRAAATKKSRSPKAKP